jgi:predicted DNA-binding transcriptional regulator AlpA
MADLLRQVDIANLLGVSKLRAHQLAHHVNFPPPVQQHVGGPLWRKSDISKWSKQHPVGDRRWGPR